MTGFADCGMVMTAALLFVGPQALTACTQNVVVLASGPMTAVDPKLKYSSAARINAMTCSSVAPPASAAVKPARPTESAGRRRKLEYQPFTRRALASLGLRM